MRMASCCFLIVCMTLILHSSPSSLETTVRVNSRWVQKLLRLRGGAESIGTGSFKFSECMPDMDDDGQSLRSHLWGGEVSEEEEAVEGVEQEDPKGDVWYESMRRDNAFLVPPPAEEGEKEKVQFMSDATHQLFDEAKHGNSSGIIEAIKNGADVTTRDKADYNRTPLHYACSRCQDADGVQALLAAGANPDACDKVDNRPLHFASESFVPEIVEALLAAGADKTVLNLWGNTPLKNAQTMSEMLTIDELVPNPDGDPTISPRMLELLDFEGAENACPPEWPDRNQEIQTNFKITDLLPNDDDEAGDESSSWD